ncbi:MAG TPA: DUF5110 domain-containing protein, partial [Kiritimatiellia bacterium]|nr:DUF5110 domain-containing protein [Kiritimatiellia bacterium]
PSLIGAACPLEQFPVYVRRGGIVFHIPQRQVAGEAVWPELAAEAYAPPADGAQVRTFHEDDGWSRAHEQGRSAATEVRLERAGATITLAIRPQPAPAGIRPARRAWALRLHLAPGEEFGEVRLDGRRLEPGEVEWLQPAGQPSAALFEGPGALPAPEGGGVVEWRGERSGDAPLEWTVRILDRNSHSSGA